MTDRTILVILGALIIGSLAALVTFAVLWRRSVERIAASVTRVAWPCDGTILSRTLDMEELVRIRGEIAWLLDVRPRDITTRPESTGQQGKRCGVVVVLRGQCDEEKRDAVRAIEGAVRGRLSRGTTCAIVVSPRVDVSQPAVRAA